MAKQPGGGGLLSSPAQLLEQLAASVGGEEQLEASHACLAGWGCRRRAAAAVGSVDPAPFSFSRSARILPPPSSRPQDLLGSVQRMQAGGASSSGSGPADALEVFPEPAWVVKTATEEGQKVFINVVGSSKLPLPGGWQPGCMPDEVGHRAAAARCRRCTQMGAGRFWCSRLSASPRALTRPAAAAAAASRSLAAAAPQVKQHLEETRGGEAPAAMRFPLSLGPPRLDADHCGAPCLGQSCSADARLQLALCCAAAAVPCS